MEKTKILCGKKSVEMEVNGTKLEQVKSFQYLAVQIRKNGSQKAEINEKLAQQWRYIHAEQKFLKDESNYKKPKVNVYK